MKKIFDTLKGRELDNYTITYEPVEPVDLVERAATVFTNEFCRKFDSNQNRIFVFAGSGNNGADALAIARLLTEKDYNVTTYLLNAADNLSAECEINRNRLKEIAEQQFTEIAKGVKFDLPKLMSQDIVIDGIFGTGLNRPVEGGLAKIIQYINKSEATIVSIDIPSGLFGENNSENNLTNIIQADMTFTFEFPKLAFLLPENADYVGKWKTLAIGLHPDAVSKTDTSYYLIEDEDIASLILPRNRCAHKGDFGNALLIAGGKGKMGAAVLAAKGCMRSGVGKLTVHLPERGETVMQTTLPEAMVSIDPNYDCISVLPDIKTFDAIGVGPGIGTEIQTAEMLTLLLEQASDIPLIIDADALNIIAQNNELLNKLPEETIITPHPGEFARLAGDSTNDYERLQKARSIAAEKKIYIILKSAYTAICTPSGDVFFNTEGHPGMATAGSGDVLTGILTALRAQGYSPEEASLTGVYIHALAGHTAATTFSEESMIASDISAMLSKAFLMMRNELS